MDAIGTQLGSVHKQRQGTGLATVLDGGDALNAATRAWQYDMADLQRRDAERQAKREAALKRLQSFSPEWFYKHNFEMKSALDAHLGKGAELLGRGVADPFTGTDAESVAFQKEHARLTAMSNASMQVKERWDALQKQVAASSPDDYDPRSIANAVSFFDIPLSEIIESGASPVTLQKKRPFLQMNEFIGKNMAAWQAARGGEQPSDGEVFEFVNSLANEPANRQQFVEGYASKLAQIEPDEKKRLEDTARAGGREVWQQMAYEDALRFRKRREAFDLQKELQQAAKMAEGGVSYSEWSTPDSFGKAPKKGSKESAIKSAVDATFNSDSRWMEVYDREGELPRGKEENDGEYAKRVKAYMAAKLDPLVGVQTKSGKTDKGQQDSERERAKSAFVEDMRSGDWMRAQGAANVLIGTRFANNLDINNATITQGPQGFNLELDLGTNLSTKDVRRQIADSSTGDVSDKVLVEDRQGRQVVKIDLSEGAISNQILARLIDNTIKEGGRYDPSLTERSPKTALEAAKAVVPTQPLKNQPTTGIDFWK